MTDDAVDPRIAADLELLTSGTVDVLPKGALAAKLLASLESGRPLRVKLGIDPSSSDLTLGHAVVLRKLRQFQDLGHLAVLIVGDFTGQIGDPTGRSAQRKLLSAEQTEANAVTYVEQVMRILDPEKVELVRNSSWLASMTMADVAREASALTVAGLLERDDFARRYATHQPISLVEFLYPLLQGYDSVAVRADVELGGTDQTYNLLVGRDLQRQHGQAEQVVVTVPLLVGLDGQAKMSKSLGNYVAITEPADEQFGKLMSIPDSVVASYATLCASLPPAEVRAIAHQVASGGSAANAAKRSVARHIVAHYHGPEAASAAEATFDKIHRDHQVPDEAPEAPLPAGDPVHLPAVLVAAGLAASTSEARRALRDGAVRVAGERVSELDLPREALVGAVVQVGRRRAARMMDG